MNKIKNPWLILIGPLLGAFIGLLSETSLNIALPSLSQSLNISNNTLQWLVTGYMLIIGIVLPLSSLLTKWFSTKRLITFGLLSFLIGSIISACSYSFIALLTGRLIQGIGTGIILPLMFTIAMNIFPSEKLGVAMGICSLVILFAPAIGPTMTGFILSKLSWHWIFWLFIPIIIIALFFELKYLVNINELSKPKIDKLSIGSSALGFGLIVMGFSFAAENGWSSLSVIICLIIGIFSLTVYILRQLHTEKPILNFKILKKEAFTKGTLLVMVDFAIIISSMFILPQFLQKGMMLPVALTGIIILPGGILNALISAISGKLYNKYGVKKLTITGYIISIIGILLLVFSSSYSNIIYIITAHCTLMIGCALIMSPSQTYALNALEINESSDGSTIINTFEQIIGAIATAVSTSLLNVGFISTQGNESIKFTCGSHYSLIFTLVLSFIGLFISFTLKKDTLTYLENNID